MSTMLQIQGVPFMHGVVTLELGQLVAVLVSLLLVAFLVYAVWARHMDFRDAPVCKATGIVLEKSYTPARHSTMKEGGECCPIMCYINVKLLSIDGEPTVVIRVDSDTYDAVEEGKQVAVDYKVGKNSGETRFLEVVPA